MMNIITIIALAWWAYIIVNFNNCDSHLFNIDDVRTFMQKQWKIKCKCKDENVEKVFKFITNEDSRNI